MINREGLCEIFGLGPASHMEKECSKIFMKSFQGISWNTIVKAERSCILGIESERTHRQRKRYDRAYKVASKRCRGNADVIRYSNQYIFIRWS